MKSAKLNSYLVSRESYLAEKIEVRSQNRIVLNIEHCVLREKSYPVGQLPGLPVRTKTDCLYCLAYILRIFFTIYYILNALAS